MSDIRGVVHNASAQPRSAKDTYRYAAVTPNGALFSATYLDSLAREGRIFVSSDADENDVIVGATSFAATTPTLLLEVPNGTVALPLWVMLQQAGTVAGGNISVAVSFDIISRYTSGGTAETIRSTRSDHPVTPLCTLYSTGGSAIVAPAASRAQSLYHQTIMQDVALVATDIPLPFADEGVWRPPAPIYLTGPASLLVFTYAATTGPSWLWSIGWAEIPETEF